MTKKRQSKQSIQKPKEVMYRINYRMPAWMREFLADQGIEEEFSVRELSKDQLLAIDYAERLCQQEMAGLICVTYDPDVDPEPQAELKSKL